MKFNYVNSKKIIAILLSSIILTSCSKNYKDIKDNETFNENKTEMNSSDENIIGNTTNTPSENVTIDNITDNNTDSTQDNLSSTNETNYTNSDLKVIDTLSNLENETDSLLESESISDKLKGIFITIVDFIFYDSEIDGVKFDDLTLEGKEKVLKIAYSIDTKIETKFPNYKDTISDKTKIAFNKVSEIIKIGANNINDFSKDLLGDNYYTLIEAKDDLVYYTKNALDYLGSFSSKAFNSGKEYIKNWYENFRQKNQD